MGSDILLLDISDVTLIADYFIIASADSERQINALIQAISEATREEYGEKPISVEGTASSGWVLMDYSGIVVHIFTPRQRSRYQLEDLWRQGRTVVRMA
jgi:ribosome-associated protein